MIDIWRDPWVPNAHTFRHILNSQEPPQVHKAHPLIDQDKRSWKLSHICNLISPIELDVIMRILIPQIPMSNKFIWKPDKKCCFSIKSAYFLSID